MKLGSSLRRRRGGRRPGSPRQDRGPLGRLPLIVAGLIVSGWLIGYLTATRVLFPAPAPPSDLAEVPDVRGHGLSTVRERLAGADLVLGPIDSLRHPTVPAGVVLGQAPLPGQLSTVQGEVRVTVSLGPATRRIPEVERLEAGRARILLETSGFAVSVDSVESDVPRGRVVSVDPPADSVVTVPRGVHLRVSTGPPVVVMPSVLGRPEEEAVAALEALGLVVEEVEEVFRFGRDQGIVVEQEPGAQTRLRSGSPVRLSVGQRSPGGG